VLSPSEEPYHIPVDTMSDSAQGWDTPSEAEKTLKKGLPEITTYIQRLKGKSKELTSDISALEHEREFLKQSLNYEEESHNERRLLLEQRHHDIVQSLSDRLNYVQEELDDRRFLLEKMHHAFESLAFATMKTSDSTFWH